MKEFEQWLLGSCLILILLASCVWVGHVLKRRMGTDEPPKWFIFVLIPYIIGGVFLIFYISDLVFNTRIVRS